MMSSRAASCLVLATASRFQRGAALRLCLCLFFPVLGSGFLVQPLIIIVGLADRVFWNAAQSENNENDENNEGFTGAGLSRLCCCGETIHAQLPTHMFPML